MEEKGAKQEREPRGIYTFSRCLYRGPRTYRTAVIRRGFCEKKEKVLLVDGNCRLRVGLGVGKNTARRK